MRSHRMSGFDIFASVLVILGAIQLGLLGIFGYNLIESIMGGQMILVRVVYSLVGFAGVWFIFAVCKCCKGCSSEGSGPGPV